ncbi:MAG: hypothetical protein JWQ72_2995 [Polaromonas sp.]|nr:hypothetical protein [Polaromonas sp.]
MDITLDQLRSCTDVSTLRSALYSLCSRFGSIRRLDILDACQQGQHQAMCFLRMDSAEQEKRMSRELGIGRFGGDLVVVVDLARVAANDVGMAAALAA